MQSRAEEARGERSFADCNKIEISCVFASPRTASLRGAGARVTHTGGVNTQVNDAHDPTNAYCAEARDSAGEKVVASRPVRRILSRRFRRTVGGGHPSRPAVARRLQRPTRGCLRTGRPPPAWPCSRWGLPSRPGRPGRWCALTAPFHPYLCGAASCDRSRHRRSVLCGTFLRVAPTGCYPAPCPVESGRSSGRCAEAPGTRPPGRLTTISIVALNGPNPTESHVHR